MVGRHDNRVSCHRWYCDSTRTRFEDESGISEAELNLSNASILEAGAYYPYPKFLRAALGIPYEGPFHLTWEAGHRNCGAGGLVEACFSCIEVLSANDSVWSHLNRPLIQY